VAEKQLDRETCFQEARYRMQDARNKKKEKRNKKHDTRQSPKIENKKTGSEADYIHCPEPVFCPSLLS